MSVSRRYRLNLRWLDTCALLLLGSLIACCVQIEAENVPEISEQYEISVVPTFLFLKNGALVDKVEGANPPALAKSVQLFVKTASAPPAAPAGAAGSGNLEDRLKKIITSSHVMLFMKGTPSEPRCGFSRKAVACLAKADVKFGTFDILGDDEVRAGLKEYSKWPTFPQLYANGKLVGGLDIMQEMEEEDELNEILGAPAESNISLDTTIESLDDRLKKLVNQSKCMLFMKGDREEPKCGFSRKIAGLLLEANISFETFDILSDEEVRQGLKEYSKWPTYPQFYKDGELVGGLDIIQDLHDEGELTDLA